MQKILWVCLATVVFSAFAAERKLEWKDLPQDQVIDSDRNYTIRAWMAVMTYMLSDWKYLYE